MERLRTPPSSPPDRFISPRRSTSSPTEAFRLSKSPKELSPTERVNRRRPANYDPFMNRRVTPNKPTKQSMLTQPTGARSSSLGSQRSASIGSVWQIGGMAHTNGPTAAIPDGRGGLLGSGTNAPMFSAKFLDAETDDQGLERFEGRLAEAMEIDQCKRVL